MYEFFKGNTDNPVEVFGGLHIGLTLGFLVLLFAMIFFRNKLRRIKNQNPIRIGMATVLLLNMVIHYTSLIIVGEWIFERDLPFHLCFITNFVFIYILFTNNKKNLFGIIYFFTLVGPIPAMTWPDLSVSYDGYLFYQFIISHHVMLLFSVYSLVVLGYRSNVKSAFIAFGAGHILVAVMFVFNSIFDTNYIMMTELPDPIYKLYPFTQNLPPLIWLEIVGIAVFLIAYIPIFIENKYWESAEANA